MKQYPLYTFRLLLEIFIYLFNVHHYILGNEKSVMKPEVEEIGWLGCSSMSWPEQKVSLSKDELFWVQVK